MRYLQVSWAVSDLSEWDRGNQLMDAFAEAHPVLIGEGAGTGFGRRDMDFSFTEVLPDDQIEALIAEITEHAKSLIDFEAHTYDDDET